MIHRKTMKNLGKFKTILKLFKIGCLGQAHQVHELDQAYQVHEVHRVHKIWTKYQNMHKMGRNRLKINFSVAKYHNLPQLACI